MVLVLITIYSDDGVKNRMKIHLIWLGFGCALLMLFSCTDKPAPAANLTSQSILPVMACEDLKGQVFAQGSIVSAEGTTSDGIDVCAVSGTMAPAINFQVLLPTRSWSGRYLQVGCGGLCGNITMRSGASDGCQLLTDGAFVMAATDMGHSGRDGAWAAEKQKLNDFAYNAQHQTALAVKAMINAFYGQPANYSYFNGCSDGGREALMEAQRFPSDFNGIIAGAPAMLFQVQNTLYHGWQARSNTDEQGKVILTADKLPLLHQAVLAACDTTDGVQDSLISQPALCDFDPASLLCDSPHSDDTCLSASEVAVVKAFYQGPKDKELDTYLTAGQPLYGSELAWQGVYVSGSPDGHLMSEMATVPVMRYIAFDEVNPALTLNDLSFSESTLAKLQSRHTLLDATNTQLDAFAQAGNKLIMWHGLSDPHISPANTVAYHQALVSQLGKDKVDSFERLYLLPGVAHCGGGQGPSKIDLLSAIVEWVELDQAPFAVITASQSKMSRFGQPDFDAHNAKPRGERPPRQTFNIPALPDMSRPVYPYPYVAEYIGTGSVWEASQWKQGKAATVVNTRSWPGEAMFGPYTFSELE